MNIFVSVIPKKQGKIDSYKHFLKKAIPYTIPFAHLEHTCKIWSNHSVLAASFSIHASNVSIKEYYASTENQFCTFNGIPLIDEFYSSNEAWGPIILNKFKEKSLDYTSIGGYYNLMLINDNKVNVFNSITRTEPVYWTENKKCIVIGNRASLVYALANKSLNFKYNIEALISMCTIGWPAHDLVPFKNINLLPGGQHVEITPNNIRISPCKPFDFYELQHQYSESELNNIYDDLTHEFIKGAKIFNKFADKLTIGLTGGKDSRLAAAMCKEAGVNFSCYTSGGPEDRDVIVAKEVANILGVEHTSTPPKISNSIPKVDVFEMLQKQIFQGEGNSNIYDPCYPIRLTPTIQFTGHGGACYKGGYDNLKGKNRPVIKEKNDAIKFVNNLNMHNHGILLTKAAKKQQEEINWDIVNKFFNTSFPAENFYDYMYTVYREPRGTGGNRQASAYGSFQNSPFLNDNALKIALKVPLSKRANTELYYNILHRLNPKLANHRFSDSRWKFEENGPINGQSLDEWKKKEPLPPSPRKQQTKSWRFSYDTYLRDTIKDYLLSNKNNDIYQIIDYSKINKLLNLPGPTSNSVLRSIYGVLGSAYLLNNDWVKKEKFNLKKEVLNLFNNLRKQ